MLFDSHSHLNDEKFDEDREEIIKKIYESGVKEFVTAGYDLKSSRKAIEMANKYDFMYATAGISPNDIPQKEEKLWKQLTELKEIIKNNQKISENKTSVIENNKKIVAIGEIGLDYHWNEDNKELQRKAFIKQIEIANEFDLPIQIHTRDAVMDTFDILKNNKVNNTGVFHCCPQNRELIKEGLKLGYYISFAGPITFKSSKNASEMIELVPNDRILIETDSPYLAPEPVRGTRNTPINVKYVAQKIAEVKNLSQEEVEKITTENAERIFKINF